MAILDACQDDTEGDEVIGVSYSGKEMRAREEEDGDVNVSKSSLFVMTKTYDENIILEPMGHERVPYSY